jgi:N-acetylated-alpha-linked acidic dipeptidase
MPTLHRVAATLAFTVQSASALAQPASAPPTALRLPGFSTGTTAEQRALEQAVLGIPNPVSAGRHMRALTTETHVAGTPAQERTRDYVNREMKALGFQVTTRSYEVWLPHATSVKLWRLWRDTVALDLSEPGVPSDPTSGLPQYVTANGQTGAGDVTAEVVFVNYGLIEDYAVLDSLGVSVAGKIVLARYGRSFRGIKAREAEKRGAVGVLIYSDPLDDGFAQGDVYPEGPMRPARGVQRGSVFNGAGDPTTPGWPSVPGARRVPLAETPVPRVPVVPISYANAQQLMEGIRGGPLPRGWQGGMPVRYHVGPGPLKARLAVATDSATAGYKRIHNTLATVRGTAYPDEIIVIGGHRDAWGPGAADNVSGVVSVIEAARAVAQGIKMGKPPKRTIVFATWDAEEWGLVGSSEYVEEDSLRLSSGGVAYLNQDGAASGQAFGGGGSPSLRALLRSVVRDIPDPKGRGTVYEVWRRQVALPDSLEPPMGDPGGGSDFAGFYNHLGIPHADWGFGGPGGVYHSAYDSYDWMTRFGDPGFFFHAAAGRIGAALALRLANAEVLPYDYAEFARTMRPYVTSLTRAFTQRGWGTAPLDSLGLAISTLEQSAVQFATVRDRVLVNALPRSVQEATNAELRKVERAFVRPSGLASRPWYRTLIYASDVDNGYSTMPLPGIGEAVRAGDATRAAAEARDLAGRFRQAAATMDAATTAVQGRAR